MKSGGPKLFGKKRRRRRAAGQTSAGQNLEQQYQELCRLREEVRWLAKKAASDRRQSKSKYRD
jgi:hypothetical protein